MKCGGKECQWARELQSVFTEFGKENHDIHCAVAKPSIETADRSSIGHARAVHTLLPSGLSCVVLYLFCLFVFVWSFSVSSSLSLSLTSHTFAFAALLPVHTAVRWQSCQRRAHTPLKGAPEPNTHRSSSLVLALCSWGGWRRRLERRKRARWGHRCRSAVLRAWLCRHRRRRRLLRPHVLW